MAQIEVDENDVTAGSGDGHREICGSRRLALALGRARDDDRLHVLPDEADVQVGLEDPERLGAWAGRLRQRGQLLGLRDPGPVGSARTAWDRPRPGGGRPGKVAEQRQAQARSASLRRNGPACRAPRAGTPNRCPTPVRPGCPARRCDVVFGCTSETLPAGPTTTRARAGCLQRLQRLQMSVAVGQGCGRGAIRRRPRRRSRSAAGAHRRAQPPATAVSSRRRYTLNWRRVGGRQFPGDRRDGIGDREHQEVGGRVRAHARVGKQAGRRAAGHVGCLHRQLRDRPREPTPPASRRTGRAARRRRGSDSGPPPPGSAR